MTLDLDAALDRLAERLAHPPQREGRPSGTFIFVMLGAICSLFAYQVFALDMPQQELPLVVGLASSCATGALVWVAKKRKVAPRDAQPERVRSLCRQIAAELKSAPEALRIALPPRAVEQLELAYRRLASERPTRMADLERLEGERAELEEKRTGATDPVVVEQLTQALAALERQRASLQAMSDTAARREAERTRLLYTLEDMLAQVQRAKQSASAPVWSPDLDRWSEQITAVADALEDVPSPVRGRSRG